MLQKQVTALKASNIQLGDLKTEDFQNLQKKLVQVQADNYTMKKQKLSESMQVDEYASIAKNDFLENSMHKANGFDYNAVNFSRLIQQNDAFSSEDLRNRQRTLQ